MCRFWMAPSSSQTKTNSNFSRDAKHNKEIFKLLLVSKPVQNLLLGPEGTWPYAKGLRGENILGALDVQSVQSIEHNTDDITDFYDLPRPVFAPHSKVLACILRQWLAKSNLQQNLQQQQQQVSGNMQALKNTTKPALAAPLTFPQLATLSRQAERYYCDYFTSLQPGDDGKYVSRLKWDGWYERKEDGSWRKMEKGMEDGIHGKYEEKAIRK
jgi:hypothetical protein